jgi:polyphosphate glucokinase
VVIGGGNVKRLKELPPGCRAGDNANAFIGGFRLWEQQKVVKASASSPRKPATKKAAKGKRK